MPLAKSTIVAPVPGGDSVLLVQPLTSQVALLRGNEARSVLGLDAGAELPGELPIDLLHDARFAVRSDEEEQDLASYQEPFDPTGGGLIKPETIDALFPLVDRYHGDEQPRPYVTLLTAGGARGARPRGLRGRRRGGGRCAR